MVAVRPELHIAFTCKLLIIASCVALVGCITKASAVGVTQEEGGVMQKSSMAMPSSEPVASKSVQRIHISAPAAKLNPEICPEITDDCNILPLAIAAAVFLYPRLGVVVQVPVDKDVADVLY